MLQYCIQTILFQLIFIIAYDFFHKKDTFFTVNRTYLLVSSILSFILPLIKIKSIQETIPDTYVTDLPTVFIGENPLINQVVQSTSIDAGSNFSINWWWLIYAIGISIMIFLLIKKIIVIRSFHKKSIQGSIHNYPIRLLPNSKDAFTFWNTIYIGDQLSEPEKKQILFHETVHLQQKHTLDLIWFELIKIIFWFNPLMYIYHARIVTLHEYISDASAIKLLGKKHYYEQLLNANFQTNNVQFVNNFFNKRLLKKRIIMLQKTKSKANAKLKYLAILPLLIIMLTVTAFSQKETALASLSSDTITAEIKELTDSYSTKEVPEKNTTNSIVRTEKAVPFAEVEKVPKTQNCKDLTDQASARKCTSDEIKKFVNKNFNISIAENIGLSGINRIYARFIIDTDGNIINVESRGPALELEEEAKRVIQSLPKMIPGKDQGKKVNVLYTLPIVFDLGTLEKKKLEKATLRDDTVLTETLSNIKGLAIKKGYYLITNIFKHKNYFDKQILQLKEKGLKPKSFINPEDHYMYIYLDRYDSLEEAEKMLSSDFDGLYKEDLYILKIE